MSRPLPCIVLVCLLSGFCNLLPSKEKEDDNKVIFALEEKKYFTLFTASKNGRTATLKNFKGGRSIMVGAPELQRCLLKYLTSQQKSKN